MIPIDDHKSDGERERERHTKSSDVDQSNNDVVITSLIVLTYG